MSIYKHRKFVLSRIAAHQQEGVEYLALVVYQNSPSKYKEIVWVTDPAKAHVFERLKEAAKFDRKYKGELSAIKYDLRIEEYDPKPE